MDDYLGVAAGAKLMLPLADARRTVELAIGSLTGVS
jgi:hypothetical protein